MLFLASLIVPFSLNLGPVHLSLYRIVLVLAFCSVMLYWLSGRAGPIRGFDICIILAFIWATIAYFVVHPSLAMIETSGILVIEAVGSYLISRTLIRSREDFERVMRFFLLLVSILFPFALYETLTGRPIILEFFNRIGDSYTILYQDPRLGLERAQVVFDHSIPYGAFVSAGFSLAFYLYGARDQKLQRFFLCMIVSISALFSVSSGALLAIFFQFGLIIWTKVTRSMSHRWLVLTLLFLFLYLGIEALSNRSAPHVFVSYMSFSEMSGYNRILIFNYGMENIWQNPLFGLGLGDWDKPIWMGDSVDNFWLLIAMRHGLPAFMLFTIGVLWLLASVGSRALKTSEMVKTRYAFMFSIIGMLLVGITVHYWGALLAFFMFLLGSGAWLTCADEKDTTKVLPRENDKSSIRYSRFA